MLLPQSSSPPLPDRDQEGFSQLLLHDLHRHRQSYVRSYTAFETLRKRQDFVLRQENLRSLQNLENRIQAKQDQLVDQSIHSYEQCFVKVINGNLNTPGHPHDLPRRVKSAGPSSDKYHLHQLSHATPLDPPSITAFHRYQKSHRPPKYRNQASLYRSAQSFHDAFQSSSFSYQSQPFLSFTESYLQKYADRSTSKYPYDINNDEIDDMRERLDEEDEEQHVQKGQPARSQSAEFARMNSANRRVERRPKASELQRVRATISSRNTNTPISSPQMGYHDAVRDGLVANRGEQRFLDPQDQTIKTTLSNEKRRSSQQSTSQQSNTDSKGNPKRPKTGKKKQVVVNLIPEKQADPKSDENNLFKSAMFVQNYDSNTPDATASTKTERISVPVSLPRKTSTVPRRPSLKAIDGTSVLRKTFDNVDTQITTTERLEQSKTESNNQLLSNVLPTIPPTEIKQAQQQSDQSNDQQTTSESVDNRKRVRKGAFDATESMTDLVQFELGLLGNNRGAMKKNRFRAGKENNLNGDGTDTHPENQGTQDLLEKIRQSSVGLNIGHPPVSQQVCLFFSLSLILLDFLLCRVVDSNYLTI